MRKLLTILLVPVGAIFFVVTFDATALRVTVLSPSFAEQFAEDAVDSPQIRQEVVDLAVDQWIENRTLTPEMIASLGEGGEQRLRDSAKRAAATPQFREEFLEAVAEFQTAAHAGTTETLTLDLRPALAAGAVDGDNELGVLLAATNDGSFEFSSAVGDRGMDIWFNARDAVGAVAVIGAILSLLSVTGLTALTKSLMRALTLLSWLVLPLALIQIGVTDALLDEGLRGEPVGGVADITVALIRSRLFIWGVVLVILSVVPLLAALLTRTKINPPDGSGGKESPVVAALNEQAKNRVSQPAPFANW